MSSKKSLGSSPIGFSGLSQNSYRFIRDLGVSKKNSHNDESKAPGSVTNLKSVKQSGEKRSNADSTPASLKKSSEQEQGEKKIVSYYLEVDLISQLKKLADNRGEYYSSVVSRALQHWIDQHNI